MPSRGVVNVVFRALGAAQVRNTMRGVATEARRADQQTTASARAAERERIRIAREEARVRSGLARDGAQAAQRAERERIRVIREAAREIRRVEAAAFREQSRRTVVSQREARREISRQRAAVGTAAGLVGGAAFGVALAAATRAIDAFAERVRGNTSALQGSAGVLDPAAALARRVQFDTRMRRASGEFFQGQDPQQQAASRAALTTEIDTIAGQTGQGSSDLLGVLETLQTSFSMFDIGRRDLRAIAEEAQRTGADMGELANFVGLVNQQLGDSAPTAERLFDIMAQQGLQSAIAPQALAEHFGGQLGTFRDVTGLQGEDAVRQFGAIANATASADPTHPEEAATRMRNLMSSLSDPRTIDRIRQATGGRQVGHGAARHWEGGTSAIGTDAEGNQRIDAMALIGDLAALPNTDINRVFRDQGARTAMGTLIGLRNRHAAGEAGVIDAETLANVDAGAGGAFRTQGLETVMGGAGAAWAQRAAIAERQAGPTMEARQAEAGQLSDFQQAMAERPVGLLSMIPDFAGAPIADFIASNTTAESRQRSRGLGPNAGMGALAAIGTGGMSVGVGNLISDLGDVGARAHELAPGAGGKAGPVELAPGTTVRLDPETIAALREQPARAPDTGRQPGGPGRR